MRYVTSIPLCILAGLLLAGCRKLENEPPGAPATPMGPTTGYVDTAYIFSTSATDPDGDSIAIRFDWGDGEVSDWSSLVASGSSVFMSHVYSVAGIYHITAKAKDIHGHESGWSHPHTIMIGVKPSWTKTYGGSYDDCGYSVNQTADGGYIIVGVTYSYGVGGSDAWVVKTDAYGNVRWQKSYGGVADDGGLAIIQTKDGGYVMVGYTRSYGRGSEDVWVVKMDANGDIEWQKAYGGPDKDWGRSIIQTVDGGYIIVGGTLSYGAGGMDVLVIKIDAYGQMEWQKTYGGNMFDDGYDVVPTDNGYLIVGTTASYGAGGMDMWAIEIDKSGDIKWQNAYGGNNWEWAYSVESTADGGYLLVGYTGSYGVGGWDVWAVKIDTKGNIEWQATYGGVADDLGYSVIHADDGGYVIAGETYSYGAGGYDVLIIEIDAHGRVEWQLPYGGVADDGGYSVIRTVDGGYVMVGYTCSYGLGAMDIWLMKIDEDKDVKVSIKGNTSRH